ncbi:MAG TPA: hypothetical protein VIN59_01115 [Alphaproteobacteria bacterium]
MRKIFAIMVLALGFGTLATLFQHRNNGIDTSVQVSDATDQYIYRKLANGTIVHELVTDDDLVNIAPAAGVGVAGEGDGAPSVEGKASYKYDPLTQTYRRTDVDSRGKSSQKIIRDPLNP